MEVERERTKTVLSEETGMTMVSFIEMLRRR